MPIGGNVSTSLIILSSEVFNLGKNLALSSAGAFEVYLWTRKTLLGKFELLGGDTGGKT